MDKILLTSWSIGDRLTAERSIANRPTETGRGFMKKTIIKLCKIVPIVLLGCFVISVITGYARYSSTLNSAPFSVWVLVDAIYFIVPALLLFVVGMILRKRWKE